VNRLGTLKTKAVIGDEEFLFDEELRAARQRRKMASDAPLAHLMSHRCATIA
jgi:hypothetical protein